MAITEKNKFVHEELNKAHDALVKLEEQVYLGAVKDRELAKKTFRKLRDNLEDLDFLIDPRSE